MGKILIFDPCREDAGILAQALCSLLGVVRVSLYAPEDVPMMVVSDS